MPKILTSYPKSAFLKVCFPGCSLPCLSHQFFFSEKYVSIGHTYMNIILPPI